MPKKEIRMITASADQAAIIDKGADVKTRLDNLTYEDRGIKLKIGEMAAGEMAEGETNIRLEGREAVATVTASERFTVKASAERYPALQTAVKNGFLRSVVTVKRDLVVPPDDVARAAEALRAAGITANVVESLSVKPDDVRTMRASEVASTEEHEARRALEACMDSDITYRVTYSNKG